MEQRQSNITRLSSRVAKRARGAALISCKNHCPDFLSMFVDDITGGESAKCAEVQFVINNDAAKADK